MKCQDCGAIGITGGSCPDCGGGNLLEEAGSTTTASAGQPDSDQTLVMPALPGVLNPADAKGPVIKTIVLPDNRQVEMREGDEFTFANIHTEETVTFRVDEETVSRTPTRIYIKDGVTYVTGGGSNGFPIINTVRHKQDEVVEVPRIGNYSVGAGKSRFRIK